MDSQLNVFLEAKAFQSGQKCLILYPLLVIPFFFGGGGGWQTQICSNGP